METIAAAIRPDVRRSAPARAAATPRDVYAVHFALRESAFNITPDPRFYYMSPTSREAYAALYLGITARKGFLLLTGETGTGKTSLIRRLVGNAGDDTRFVVVPSPLVTFDELLAFTCAELQIEAGPGRLAKFTALQRTLETRAREGQASVLVIDEAQQLDDHVLEPLRLLSNLETGAAKLLQIVLSGQPELCAKLEQPQLRQFKHRIAVRAQLDRLKPRDVPLYIASRLETAGCRRGNVFTPDAIEEIAACSLGIPRLVNVLCDNALLVAYGLDALSVTREAVREAASDLGLPGEAPAARTDATSAAPASSRIARRARRHRDRRRSLIIALLWTLAVVLLIALTVGIVRPGWLPALHLP